MTMTHPRKGFLMRSQFTPVRLLLVLMIASFSARPGLADPAPQAGTRLTLYNQGFAVVRETLPLDLKAGGNQVRFSDVTTHLEPASVILRDPSGKRSLQVLEQNYRADPVSQELLLSHYEGQMIDFVTTSADGQKQIVHGKIIRSGYVPAIQPYQSGFNGYGYYPSTPTSNQPIIEVDGKLQFSLPGMPIFPALTDDSILKPELNWTLDADKGGPFSAELAYVTSGLTWKADYNITAPTDNSEAQEQTVSIIGWITMTNQSGKTFDNAQIKLMAGDVNKIQPQNMMNGGGFGGGMMDAARSAAPPPVTEKSFDEYHLYTLQHATTLRDQETKQVEFIKAANVKSKILYIYDGAYVDPNRYNGYSYDNIRNTPDYGTQSNPKVWIMREIVNSEANGLGIPLPKGQVRFYRQDTDGQLEFIGDNEIDHTPKDETLRIYTGNAFDLTGERKQTSYKTNYDAHIADESFEVKVRNHKKTPVTMRVVEHLYRALNWEITSESTPHIKKDSTTVEFPVTLAPDEEKTIAYTVHYTW